MTKRKASRRSLHPLALPPIRICIREDSPALKARDVRSSTSATVQVVRAIHAQMPATR